MAPTPLTDPVLVAPRHEHRVSPDALTLSWEAVAGAERYTVEVARDTAFQDIVVSSDASLDTEISLAGVFAADSSTYYWRVLAVSGEATSAGERVESFIVQDDANLRAGDVQGAVEQIDRREDLGPAAELASSTGTTAANEATAQPDDAWADELTAEGVEPEDVASGQILGIFLAVAVAVIVIAVVLINWTGTVADKANFAAASSQLNPNASVARYPVLAQADQNAANALDGYEVLDASTGTYRIPIEQAIQLMANATTRAGSTSADSTGAGWAVLMDPPR